MTQLVQRTWLNFLMRALHQVSIKWYDGDSASQQAEIDLCPTCILNPCQ